MPTPLTVRQEFASWLRSKRDEIIADSGDEDFQESLEILGLDDRSLARFATAENVLVSLPHASPNVFFPRVGVSWYVRHLQQADDSAFHLRVVLTHVNFSDLGWRPYAWWYLDTEGALRRETLFTRNKKAKHVVVASQGPLQSVPNSAGNVDRKAARLAKSGINRAISYMLLMATVEESAGLSVSGSTLYVPLNLVVEFFRDRRLGPGSDSHQRWADALLESSPQARSLSPSGELAASEAPGTAFVLDNSSNIALLSLLSCTGIVGGAKMAGYWHEVGDRVTAADRAAAIAVALPSLVRLPDGIDYLRPVPPSPRLARELEAAGIGYSQGMALAEHGRFAERIDPFN
ncbi:hypothetical protein ACFC1R_08945 [Kitasatospora sp. NPDC056138]|uniref:hypothetical protein n=1 Tax=Kitasatospora sp. NPDC056138 TaxID=3345724 RepID=UPI0035D6253A